VRVFSAEERFAAAQMARADLYFFSRWMFQQRKGYAWQRAKHHKIVCDALMRVFRGETRRLIINIPPRYSKTELAVVNFIAWALGRVPDAEFIHTSYASPLAMKNSVATRELVQHEGYREIFPSVVLDSEAKHHWTTTDGGVMYATGAGGTITGFGAGKMRPGFGGAIIIDDPHKADEARSDVIRQGVIDWFQNTLESRKNSVDTPIILIMQRLHEEDLSGWLLNGGNGEEWEHVCLSAIQDDGTALWPEKHSIEELRRMEIAAPYMFAGQYQQMPSPPAGKIFLPDAMPVVEAIPHGTRFVRGWDFASVENDGDWTVGGKIGQLPDGRFIVADIAREQGGPEFVEAMLKNTADTDGYETRIRIPQDPGQAGKSEAKRFTTLLAGYSVTAKPPSGDKVVRAQPFAAQVNVGNVLLLRAPWNDALKSEMRMFPNGKHDDQVDACSDGFNELTDNTFGLLDHMAEQVKNQSLPAAAPSAQDQLNALIGSS